MDHSFIFVGDMVELRHRNGTLYFSFEVLPNGSVRIRPHEGFSLTIEVVKHGFGGIVIDQKLESVGGR